MQVLILADLHDDFWADSNRNPFEGLEHRLAELDLLLLAGDIANKPKVRWKYAFERLSRLISLDKVSVFPGNHDFYGFRLDGQDRLREIAASLGVSYVQQQQITLGRHRILCATLWTDLKLRQEGVSSLDTITRCMNDYRYIRVASKGYRRLHPSDVVARHKSDLEWLVTKLGEPFEGETIVATHHAPHPSVLKDYNEGLDAAYASDLSEIIETYQASRWFYGHSHDGKDVTVGQTRVQNVSLGYPDEVSDPAKQIERLIFEM